MDNEKVKRNRNAYKAFAHEKTIEGATRISSSKNWITTQEEIKQWTTKKQMPTELLCRKLPKQRFKKKITKSLLQIFLKLVNYVN